MTPLLLGVGGAAILTILATWLPSACWNQEGPVRRLLTLTGQRRWRHACSINQELLRNLDDSCPENDAATGSKDIRLAACALLLELANADDEFTDDERQHLESAVRRQFGLDATRGRDSCWSSRRRQREEAVDLWQFTNLIAENYSTGQKMVLAEIMWGLVYSDGDLASKEDYLMRKICNLLRLEPGYLAEAGSELGHSGRYGSGVTPGSQPGIFPLNERPTPKAPTMRDLVPGGYSSPTRSSGPWWVWLPSARMPWRSSCRSAWGSWSWSR